MNTLLTTSLMTRTIKLVEATQTGRHRVVDIKLIGIMHAPLYKKPYRLEFSAYFLNNGNKDDMRTLGSVFRFPKVRGLTLSRKVPNMTIRRYCVSRSASLAFVAYVSTD